MADDNFINVLKEKFDSYKDWKGNQLKLDGIKLSQKDKFDEGTSIPRSNSELLESPYSTRDTYLSFGDTSTDYFKHGLQIIDNLGILPSPELPIDSKFRLSDFKSTPFENNDPVMFGFDIIIDDLSSPLLNGAVYDFINNYSSISEISSKKSVYDDFRRQFIKFFKTKTSFNNNPDDDLVLSNNIGMSKTRESGYPEAGNSKEIFLGGKKSYLNYYLKKIGGLNLLAESNTPGAKKYLVDYGKDLITLDLSEDVSLSMGTLAHLYKLLYWSKPNGKSLIPENLLRFNCDIVVSEIRNYNRVIKAADNGDIKIIKDNVSRYVYSLTECQFYFNSMPHSADIDMGAPSTYAEAAYKIQFDFKYSSVKFEKFVPKSGGLGQYIGYDGGAIWKIGNGKTSGGDSSLPKFYTVGGNSINSNGVDKELVLVPSKDIALIEPRVLSSDSDSIESSSSANVELIKNESKLVEDQKRSIEKDIKGAKASASRNKLKDDLKKRAEASIKRELQSIVNVRVALLNKTLNKILSAGGLNGMTPPRNIYTDSPLNASQRLFYDVRGELLNFAGNSLGKAIGGGLTRGF